MNHQAFFPELGNLEVVEVYHYYDEPVLFVCRNERDSLFLAALAEDARSSRLWLYAPMSHTRYEVIRSGGMDLKDAFQNVEDRHVFAVSLSADGTARKGEWRFAPHLPAELLPEEGERLALQPDTLPDLNPNVVRLARQANREIIAVAFDFLRADPGQAPAGLLGQLLSGLQETINAVGQAVLGKGTKKGSIPANIISKTEMSVAGFFRGSFGVEMRATQDADLFGYSDVHGALERFMELLRTTHDPQQLLPRMTELKGRSAIKYQDLIGKMVTSVNRVEVRWGSPGEVEVKSVELTKAMLIAAWAVLKDIKPEEDIEFQILGRLTGFNIRTKTFEIWDVNENEKYAGRVDDEALTEVGNAIIDETYQALILQSQTIEPTGDVSTKNRLMRLWTVGGEQLDEGAS